MRVEFRARAVRSPQQPPLAIEQRIARALKWQVARQLANVESVLLEPLLEMRLLATPFAVKKMREHHVVTTTTPAFAVKTKSGNRRCGSTNCRSASGFSTSTSAFHCSIASSRVARRMLPSIHGLMTYSTS